MAAGKHGPVTSAGTETPVFFDQFLYNVALSIKG
jgi:hypothetical protein